MARRDKEAVQAVIDQHKADGLCQMLYYRWNPPELGNPPNIRDTSPIYCDEKSVTTLARISNYPDLAGPIDVCQEHISHVERDNWLQEAIRDGSLATMIAEQEAACKTEPHQWDIVRDDDGEAMVSVCGRCGRTCSTSTHQWQDTKFVNVEECAICGITQSTNG